MSPDSQPPSEPALEASPPTDPRDLVARMVAAEIWPEPAILEQIVAAGEGAVEPLLEVLRSRPHGWPAEAALSNAIGLIQHLGARSAIPDLAGIAKDYLTDTAQDAGDALAALGDEGYEVLLGVIRDPAVSGYKLTFLAQSAKDGTADRPDRKARLSEILRGRFEQFIEEARAFKEFEDDLLEVPAPDESVEEDVEEIDDIDDLEDMKEDFDESEFTYVADAGSEPSAGDGLADRRFEQAENEVPPEEMLAFLSEDLGDLADPDARELLRSAFDEGLIDDSIIELKDVEAAYREGGRISSPRRGWLENYRDLYADHRRSQRELAEMQPLDFPSRTSYPSFDRVERNTPPAAPVRAIDPIRNTGPKIGRNDPCWCNSGKKYKKCHWGKDGQA